MRSIQQLLETRRRAPVTVAPADTTRHALALMAEHDIGAVLVLEAGRVVGIMSERDFVRKVGLWDRSAGDTLVREVMSPRVRCVTPVQTVEECLALMTNWHFRHLPVVDEEGHLLGILSIGDLVKETLSLQAFKIDQLERYITG